jgi:ElaB/YqjD/DUF883 family membrane-anchored ribosome-binding protein
VTAFGQIVFIVEVCQQWWTEAVSTHGREPLRRPSERVLKSLRAQAIAKKVQDNPLGSMLIAGAIGFALALLMTRPPRRSPQRWR